LSQKNGFIDESIRKNFDGCIFYLRKLEQINVVEQRLKKMTRIRDVVQKALTTGYLSVEAENQLRKLLTTRYDWEDFSAFVVLQEAAMNGRVKQESRERCGIK
jgi:hypothetical protein